MPCSVRLIFCYQTIFLDHSFVTVTLRVLVNFVSLLLTSNSYGEVRSPSKASRARKNPGKE